MSKKSIQYMPFDALKGYQESLRTKEIKPTEKPTLASDKLEELSLIFQTIKVGDLIEIVYYNKTIKHLEGVVKKIDLVNKKITIEAIVILINDILDLKKID